MFIYHKLTTRISPSSTGASDRLAINPIVVQDLTLSSRQAKIVSTGSTASKFSGTSNNHPKHAHICNTHYLPPRYRASASMLSSVIRDCPAAVTYTRLDDKSRRGDRWCDRGLVLGFEQGPRRQSQVSKIYWQLSWMMTTVHVK